MMPFASSESSTSKVYKLGTQRACEPEQTYAKASQFFARAGLTRVADVTGLDSIGVPVFIAIRPNSKSLSVSQGKGFTPILAKVSAVMESLELYHAENMRLPLVNASYHGLASSAVDPFNLNLAPHSLYHPDLKLEWVAGIDLFSGQEKYVPYDILHCAYLREPLRKPVLLMNSNGLASGNNVLEASSHAICEVIERDAVVAWEVLNQDADTGGLGLVRQETIQSEPAGWIFEKLRSAGVTAYIWENGSDTGLPVFGCALVEHSPRRSSETIGPFTGFGCHLNKEVALLRAMTEAVQSRLTFISGSRDDIYRSDYARLGGRFTLHSIQTASPLVDYRDVPSLETDSFEKDLQVELAQLARVGLDQVIFVDLTDPEMNIPVVRVVIPGTSFTTQYRGRQARLNSATKKRLTRRILLRQLAGA